jgi:hypothetical protein
VRDIPAKLDSEQVAEVTSRVDTVARPLTMLALLWLLSHPDPTHRSKGRRQW